MELNCLPLRLEWKEGWGDRRGWQGRSEESDFLGGEGICSQVGHTASAPSAREWKRTKKQGTPKKDMQNANLVGSGGEHRREQ
jgi:hypothetical protein